MVLSHKKDKEGILKERAEKLALLGTSEQIKTPSLEVVVFVLAGEKYAIESCYILEVYPIKEITYLPCSPSFIYGVMNIRRKIYSIIDLRILLHLPIAKTNGSSKAIIIGNEHMSFGLYTELIHDLRKLQISEIQDPLPSMTGIYQEFIKGITEDRLVLLDGEKLLNSNTLIIQQTMD